jgi:hypothetical protein
MMPMQLMQAGGPVVRGASPDNQAYGIEFAMQRMGGTGMPTMSSGELDATLPVEGGVLSLHAKRPMGPSRLQRFMRGGEANAVGDAPAQQATQPDPRTTALDSRILKLAGLPPMDVSQADPAVVQQVYRILGRV